MSMADVIILLLVLLIVIAVILGAVKKHKSKKASEPDKCFGCAYKNFCGKNKQNK